jgi:hypothetical protein
MLLEAGVSTAVFCSPRLVETWVDHGTALSGRASNSDSAVSNGSRLVQVRDALTVSCCTGLVEATVTLDSHQLRRNGQKSRGRSITVNGI